jgi:hypothetical protein
MPIINNINFNRNLGMVVQNGNLITTYWNEYGMLEQQYNLLKNDIVHVAIAIS